MAAPMPKALEVSPNLASSCGRIIIGITLPIMEPKPRAEDRAARSPSVLAMAESSEPMGMLNMV